MGGWKSEVSKEEGIRQYWSKRDELSVEGGCILWGGRVIIPESLRETVLLELHDVHPGITRMKVLARSFVWWPKMDEDLETIAKKCSTCALNQSNPAAAPVHPWETPTQPWMRIHMDFAGPLLNKMFLIVVDAYSKWLEVAVMTEATARATVNKLRQIFSTHGLPKVSVSDNGPAFIGEEFKAFMKRNGVKQVYSAPYHPASNGQAERMVRTFKESLATLKEGDLQTKLDRLLYKYRITPNSTTGQTPAKMMFNRELRSPFHLLQPGAMSSQKEKVEEKQTTLSQNQVSKNVRTFEKGALVWARNFGQGEKWIEGTVERKLGRVTYEISFQDNKENSNRHIDHLKERHTNVQQEIRPSIEVVVQQDSEARVLNKNSDKSKVPQQEGEKGNPSNPETVIPSPLSPTALRRSTRTTKKPSWVSDFVTK